MHVIKVIPSGARNPTIEALITQGTMCKAKTFCEVLRSLRMTLSVQATIY